MTAADTSGRYAALPRPERPPDPGGTIARLKTKTIRDRNRGWRRGGSGPEADVHGNLSTGRHLACQTDAHRAVVCATKMPNIRRGSGGRRLTTCRGGVSGGTLGVVEATGGLRPTADRTSGPWGDGPGVGRFWGTRDDRQHQRLARLLGPPCWAGSRSSLAVQPVRLAGRHAQALAALLALRPRPRLRDAIAADLWPDFDGPSASSLRQALWLVRTGLAASGVEPDSVLEVGQDTLGLRPDLELETDVASFERLVATGPQTAVRALDLYRGDLAEGLGHECFAADRERLSDLYEDALVAVAEERLEAGDMAGARSAATQVLARDPLREEAHAVLIAAYGQGGSRSQVIRQYRRLCEVLQAGARGQPAARDRSDVPCRARRHGPPVAGRAPRPSPRGEGGHADGGSSTARRSPGSCRRAPERRSAPTTT